MSPNPCGQIGETVDVRRGGPGGAGVREEGRNTLVLVTADHAHSSQIVDKVTEEDLQGIAEDAKLPIERVREAIYPGLTRGLTTADDAEMTVCYGTSDNVAVEDQGHTGSQLRIAAFGPSAANVVGLTDQSDLFFTMTDALGINRS